MEGEIRQVRRIGIESGSEMNTRTDSKGYIWAVEVVKERIV